MSKKPQKKNIKPQLVAKKKEQKHISFKELFDHQLLRISEILNSFSPFHTHAFVYSLFLIAGYVFLVNAWIGDDAFITARTIDNFYNGYGLTFNTSERVQAYTHPLWLIINALFYFIAREPYFTNLAISFVFTFASFYLMAFVISKDHFVSSTGIILLLFSKSFIDYTSSGLENPLSYFLAGMILWIYYDYKSNKRLFVLSLLVSLAMLSRMDFILLFAPILVYELKNAFSFKKLASIAMGFLPLIAWLLFSTLYYGFPLPNTANAKLNLDFPDTWTIISHGISYFINSLSLDPITLLFIFGIIIAILIKKKQAKLELPIIIGILLYLLYILKIGGDFMTGRFFSVPIFIAVLVYLKMEIKNKTGLSGIIILVTLLIGLINYQHSPILSNASAGKVRKKDIEHKTTNPWWQYPFTDKHGITDERVYWYNELGFLNVIVNGLGRTNHENANLGLISKDSRYKTFLRAAIGMFSYYAGPKKYIIDYYALADALLARLPNTSKPDPAWRPGHNERILPMMYYETIDQDTNIIKDERIRAYYDKLCILIKKDVFSRGRFAEIINFNLGKYDDLIHNDYKTIEEKKYYISSADSVHLAKWINNLGVKAARQGDVSLANYYYRKGFSYDSTNETINSNIVGTYIQLAQYDSAYFFAKKRLTSGKINITIRHLFLVWAKDYGAKRQYDSASMVIKEWLRYEPNNDIALSNFGYYCLMQGDYATAKKYWHLALGMNPKEIDHLYNLYQLYLNADVNLDSAAKYAKEILRKGKRLPDEELNRLKGYIN